MCGWEPGPTPGCQGCTTATIFKPTTSLQLRQFQSIGPTPAARVSAGDLELQICGLLQKPIESDMPGDLTPMFCQVLQMALMQASLEPLCSSKALKGQERGSGVGMFGQTWMMLRVLYPQLPCSLPTLRGSTSYPRRLPPPA